MHNVTNQSLRELDKSFKWIISQLPQPINLRTQNAIRLINKNIKKIHSEPHSIKGKQNEIHKNTSG